MTQCWGYPECDGCQDCWRREPQKELSVVEQKFKVGDCVVARGSRGMVTTVDGIEPVYEVRTDSDGEEGWYLSVEVEVDGEPEEKPKFATGDEVVIMEFGPLSGKRAIVDAVGYDGRAYVAATPKHLMGEPSCGMRFAPEELRHPLEHEKNPAVGATPTDGYHDRKFDANKSRVDLIPGEALEALGDVLAYGCIKYAEDSWKLVPDAQKRYLAALGRHYAAMLKGEVLDVESGKPHIEHILTNAAFLVYFQRSGK